MKITYLRERSTYRVRTCGTALSSSSRRIRSWPYATILLSCIASWSTGSPLKQLEAWPSSPRPLYRLSFTSLEYQLFLDAAGAAVQRYGGQIDYSTAIASSGRGGVLEWRVQLVGSDTIDAWALYSAEQSARLVSISDFDRLDDGTKAGLKAAKSLTLKLEQARLNPLWDLVSAEAIVGLKPAAEGTTTSAPCYTLTSNGQTIDACGPTAASLKQLVGKRVLVSGYVKDAGRLELAAVRPVQEGTLEIVVMSQCPFGVKAADAVIAFLKTTTSPSAAGPKDPPAPATSSPLQARPDASEPPLTLSIRYLFYKRQEPGPNGKTTTTWWSLHGEPELHESLVQMVIRDAYSDHFLDYVHRRAHAPDGPWQVAASQAGLSPEDVRFIDGDVRDRRDVLIESEYAYVNGVLGVSDGSPTYIWESRPVKDIRAVPGLSRLDLNTNTCTSLTQSK